MESNAFRAMTIGVGVLIAIATISLVMTYYNTAKESVASIGKGTDLSAAYNKHILDILAKPNAVGTDVINLLNYFEGNNSVNIRFYKKDGKTEIKRSIDDIKANERFYISTDKSYTNINIIVLDNFER